MPQFQNSKKTCDHHPLDNIMTLTSSSNLSSCGFHHGSNSKSKPLNFQIQQSFLNFSSSSVQTQQSPFSPQTILTSENPFSPVSIYQNQQNAIPHSENRVKTFSIAHLIPSTTTTNESTTKARHSDTDIIVQSRSPSPPSSSLVNITQLFPEILSEVFSYLDTKDKGNVAQTCHYFNQILKNKQIWKNTEAKLNLRPNQTHIYNSLQERGIIRVQVLSLKRSLRELTTNIKVTHLRLSGCYNINDRTLNSMQILPSLVELNLSLCKQITDVGIVNLLGKTPALEKLVLGGCCNLTDRAALLISYGLRNLESLDLRSCYSLTDKCLAYLSGEVNLLDRSEVKTYNFLARNGLIDCELCSKKGGGSKRLSDLINLRKIDKGTEFGMLSLRNLVLQDCQKISDVSLHYIGRLQTIQSLDLSFCVNITDNGLKHLIGLRECLRELNFRNCDNISDNGFQSLRECGAIEHLDLSFCEKITSLNHSVCKNLTTLSLSACDVGDKALGEICKMEKLETLNLGQCSKVTDAGVKSIMDKCPNLQYIDLYGCSNISSNGLQAVMKMPKLKNVNLGLWKV